MEESRKNFRRMIWKSKGIRQVVVVLEWVGVGEESIQGK